LLIHVLLMCLMDDLMSLFEWPCSFNVFNG
jgi:hypothetical protein